ncbi:hypothetical protein QE152_g21975 [Popillia japonica]|uniref:CCHC-type domain-containing protein n=1 Tax=Popillia japonica TaxID=7064 RepID=A0AAW1KM91_POPJA
MNLMLECLTKGENINTSRLYSNVTKKNSEVLVVKPKHDKQSEITKKDVKTKINPGKLAVGVETVTNISSGGIGINCSNNESKEKIKDTVRKELGNKYEIIEPKLKNPKIIAVGIESEIIDQEDNEILDSIIKQNALREIDDSIADQIKIIRKYKPKAKRDHGNIVIEVDIIRCFKCMGFNHFAKDCRNDIACGKCINFEETLNMKLDYVWTVEFELNNGNEKYLINVSYHPPQLS